MLSKRMVADFRSVFAYIGRMEITRVMLRAARSAEFAYFQQNRLTGARFVPIADGQLLAMLEAAIGAIGEDDEHHEPADVPAPDPAQEDAYIEIPRPKRPIVVRATKPRPRRR